MVSARPRHVVSKVVNRRYAGERMSLTGWEENKAESDVIACAVSKRGEGLTSQSIAEAIHPISDRPSVTDCEASWVAPYTEGSRIRKLAREGLLVVDKVASDKQVLSAGKVEIHLEHMRIQSHRRGRIETESTCIQTIADASIIGWILSGGRSQRIESRLIDACVWIGLL